MGKNSKKLKKKKKNPFTSRLDQNLLNPESKKETSPLSALLTKISAPLS